MTNEEAIERLRRVKELKVFGTSYMPAIDLAIAALERNRWISVEERLPEHHNWCLVLGENLYDMDFINSRGVWNTHDKPFSPILFWRPLPEPPKEEEHDE